MIIGRNKVRVYIRLFKIITYGVFIIIGMLLPIAPSRISTSHAATLAGSTYYVDVTNGLDTNAGTLSNPWKTIQKCLNQVQAGDTCEVFGGTYSEALTLKTSGSQSARITIKNYNGQTVTVNSGSSRTLVTSGNIGYYTIDGFRFITNGTPSGSTDASVNLAYNYWGDGHTAEKGNDGFILRNCYIEGAIYIYGSDNLVENCELYGKSTWMNGLIERSQPSENNIFRQNVIHDYTQRGGWSMQFTDNSLWQDNLVYNNGEMGIDCDGAGYPVTRCNVKNNIIHDITGEGVGILLENTFNSVIEANEIYNTKQGIGTINYGTPISQVEYRTTDTNTIIRNNLIHDTSNDGIICKASPGGKALNNTFYNTRQSPGYWAAIGLSVYEGYYCHNWEIKNNIISQSSKYAIWIDSTSSWLTNLSMDYNLYDFGASEAKIYWVERGTSTVYHSYTLAQFQSAKGLELHSVRANPLFENAANMDFHLQSSSPAINQGTSVDVSSDFDGISRPQGSGFDIGAYEFVEQTQTTATNTPSPTSTETSTPTATNTPLPTSTYTPTSTATNTPLPTSTNTLTPTATNTPLPTSTYTPTSTATNTPLPTSTDSSTPTVTNTPLPTSTNTPTPTATNTPLNTSTNTPIPTYTNTVSPTSTYTPTPTATGINDLTSTPVTCNPGEIGNNQLIGCIYTGTNFDNLSGPAPSGNIMPNSDIATGTILDYDWGLSAPNEYVGRDNFSAKWKGDFTLSSGTYTFTVGSDDGIRVKIDGVNVIDAWRLQEFTTHVFTQTYSSQETIPIEVEYFEMAIDARVHISYIYETSTDDPSTNLSWQAEDGIIASPFLVDNGYLYQPQTTNLSNSGEARFPFYISVPGMYVIQSQVNAPTDGNNSFFVNIDGQPTDPSMIWDVNVTSEFESQLVSWRGDGDSSQNQFDPKVFTLGIGNHELIIRGREGNTQLDSIGLVLVDSDPIPAAPTMPYQVFLPVIISQ